MRRVPTVWCALFLFCPLAARAGATRWDGGGADTNWGTALNWSNDIVPGPARNVVFDATSAKDCVVNGDYVARRFIVQGAYTGTITIPAGCSLTVGDDFSLGGRLVVEGTLALNDATVNTILAGGELVIAPGGELVLADGSTFLAQAGSQFTVAGDRGTPGVVRSAGGGALGDFELAGDVQVSWAEFRNLNDFGLLLSSGAGATVSMAHVSFRDSGAFQAWGSHINVTGAAWAGHVFDDVSFEDLLGPDNPAYAVNTTQDVTFNGYDDGAGAMFGAGAVTPFSSGTVGWTMPDLVVTLVDPSDTTPTTGATITVDVTVENQGDGRAWAFRTQLFYDSALEPPVGSTGDQWQEVTELLPFGSTVLTFAGVTNAVVEVWQMWALADSPDWVRESDGANNAQGPVPVTWNPPLPDLVVTTVAPSTSTPTVGDTISVDVTVSNSGPVDATELFIVALFYNSAGPPTVGDTPDATQSVLGLSFGVSSTVTFSNITNATPGTWDMYAIVDNGNAVTESDETNNVSGAESVQWLAPDLVVTFIAPSTGSPAVGDTISVDVTVSNGGPVDATESFVVALFHDCAAPPNVGDTPDATQVVAGLAAGTSTTVTFSNITNATPEAWSMYAIADNGAAVTESDETNNVTGPQPVQWLAPDLVVQTVAPSNPTPGLGEIISVDVTVSEGSGAADAGPFVVALFYDCAAPPNVGDTPDATQSVATLAAGTSTTVTFSNITDAAPGTWSMYAIVDNGAAVVETDETNNVSGAESVQWLAPDLVVESVTPSDSSPGVGETISVDVTVREDSGAADAGPFVVALFYDRATPPGAGDAPDATQTVAGLAAGNTATVIFAGITSDVLATWDMYVFVDRDDTVVETDDTNNVAGPVAVLWLVPGVELLITGFTTSDATPPLAGTIDVDVTVLNQGSVDAGGFSVELFHHRGSPPAVGEASDDSQTVSSLTAGTETTVTFAGVWSLSAGVWQMYAIVDNGEAVDEVDETNNVAGPAGVLWLSAGVDLVILEMAPSNATPSARGTITVELIVLNQGGSAAGSFSVELFLDSAAAPSVGDAGDMTQSVASLAGGTLTTLTFTGVSSTALATWSTYAVVDNGGSIAEDDETNNVSGPVTVEWLSPATEEPYLGTGCGGVTGAPALVSLAFVLSALRRKRFLRRR